MPPKPRNKDAPPKIKPMLRCKLVLSFYYLPYPAVYNYHGLKTNDSLTKTLRVCLFPVSCNAHVVYVYTVAI